MSLSEDLDEFTLLERRVERVESSMENILDNISHLMYKLEGIAEERVRRRATMMSLLDCVHQHVDEDEMEHTNRINEVVKMEIKRWSH